MIFHPARMGLFNKRALVRQLQKAGTASRADLARSLGMSQPTAGKIVDELLASQVLEEIEVGGTNGHSSPQLGRPGRRLQLNRSQPGFLGIQLGVQETQLAELPLGTTNVDNWQYSFRTPTSRSNPGALWERGLCAAAKKFGGKNYLGVLLSAPGVVDEFGRRILFSPNIHWSEYTDLPAIIQHVWDAPMLIVQEERALGLGHHVNHPQHEDFLLVDFGDGVGGAVMVGGKPLASTLPISGEIGHTPALGNRRPCGCGATGCVETLVSMRGLLDSFSTAHPKLEKSWFAFADCIAKNGVEPWLAQSLDAAAMAIAGALNVLGLRHVVITGSLVELGPAVIGHLSSAIQNGAMWARFGEVECVSAPRRRTAGLVAVGIDRLIVPETEPKISSGRNAALKM